MRINYFIGHVHSKFGRDKNNLKSIVHSWQNVLSKCHFLMFSFICSCIYFWCCFQYWCHSWTQSGKRLGRLVNHREGRAINSRMKVVMDGDTPALCLFFIKPILKGSEILYHYGVNKLPWKNKKVWTNLHFIITQKLDTILFSNENLLARKKVSD